MIGANQASRVGDQSGAVYIFDLTTGTELHKLLPDDLQQRDFFGHGVGISGNRAIVGSHGDDVFGLNSGSAYLFDVTTGEQLMKLVPSDGQAGDQFGYWAAISGNVAIVGSKYDDDLGNDSGSAYLFDVTTGQELRKLTASDGGVGTFLATWWSLKGTRPWWVPTAITGWVLFMCSTCLQVKNCER